MKKEQLFELIGEADEEAVTAAAQPTKPKRKHYQIGAGIAAAVCICALAGSWIWVRQKKPESGSASCNPAESSFAETAVESAEVRIYFWRENEMQSETQFLPCTPEKVFGAWKALNGIGDEVTLLSSRVESNRSERVESGAAQYSAGDTFILHITVSANLSDYYDVTPQEQLVESLRLTMTGYSRIEYDAFDLKLE